MAPIVSRFVVVPDSEGGNINEKTKVLNNKNIHPIINVLGEHYSEKEEAENDKEKYLNLMKNLEDKQYSISVKPTQLGLDTDETDLFFNYMEDIVKAAMENEIFVWIDMESYDYIGDTIEVYNDLNKNYENVGICLQANVKRTENDLAKILENEGHVRLVKGAYKENPTVAYQRDDKIDSKFKEYIDMYSTYDNDSVLEIGTHDSNMIDYARNSLDEVHLQMLMGIRGEYQKEIANSEDVIVSQYVPYGEKWFPYFWRRCRENPYNIVVGLRNLF